MSFIGRKSDLTRLVERCQKQDAEAWAILIDRYSDFVYSVARRYRLNDDDSANVFQGTFQALHLAINQIEQPETLPKWLAVTASRLCIRTLRSAPKAVSFETDEGDLTEVIASEDAGAEASAIQACEAKIIRDAVASLGGRCRALLELLYLTEDSSYQQASDQLGIPIGAIGPTRARCLEKLRASLKAEGFFE